MSWTRCRCNLQILYQASANVIDWYDAVVSPRAVKVGLEISRSGFDKACTAGVSFLFYENEVGRVVEALRG